MKAKLSFKTEEEFLALWKKFDTNLNGALNYGEIEYSIRHTLRLPVQFHDKHVIMQAFNHCKNLDKKDGVINKSEFASLLQHLIRYYSYWYAYKQIDRSSDLRIEKSEFIKAIPKLKGWGVEMD